MGKLVIFIAVLFGALNYSYSQCESFINPLSISSGCYTAESKVTWTDLVNVNVNGNNISRTSGNSWGGSGAASKNEVTDNMYIYTVANETNRYRMIGLSNGNTNAHYNTIDFAIYLSAGGSLQIYESGIFRGVFGTYATGDTLMVYAQSGQINYYRNSNLIYASGVSPVFPLLVDASIYSNNGTLEEVTIGGFSGGSFSCNAVNVGSSPVYQWKLNGSNVGTNSSTYTNTGLTNSDTLVCEVTPTAGFCSNMVQVSNKIGIHVASNPDIEVNIGSTYLSNGCVTAEAPVVWTDLVNVNVIDNNLTRNSGNSWGGAGAASVNEVTDNMYMYTVANETNRYRMVGLSNSNTNAHYNTIDFAIYLAAGGALYVYESGANRGYFGTYTTGDTLLIYIESGQVNYYKNSNLFYSSGVSPAFPLLVDASIYSNNGTIEEVVVGGYTNGTFTCNTTNAGSNPTYQWKLNGLNVGSNNASYTNLTLGNNDTVTCEVVPDLPLCSSTTIESNLLYFIESTSPGIEVDVTSTYLVNGCVVAESEVVWTDLVNVNVNGNSISRTSGNSWGGSGAASVNTVTDNMYMYTVVNETNRFRMVGLSNGNTNANYTSIDYAIYLVSGGSLQIYESGAYRGAFGTYTTGDTIKIYVESGQVNYYKNSALIYSSGVSPVFPLIVDASIYSNNGTIENVVVGGYTNGTFLCHATNVGSNPAYQWKLNGANVGTNSASYSNTGFSTDDDLICEVTPDINLCSATNNIVSATTTMRVETSPGIEVEISPAYLANGCTTAESPVIWTDIVNADVNINGLARSSGNSWGGSGAASVNELDDNTYMYTVVNETNRRRMIGLSNGNTNAHYNTIDFAVYLNSNGNLHVFESGTNRGTFGTYSTGDTLKIHVESGQVNYYKNSALFYSSGVSPVFPLIVDASIYSNNGTLENVIVGGYTNGSFTCNTTNVGVNPTYQWKLNGANVGTNSAAYTSTSLSDNDVLICDVTPDITLCSASGVSSNEITMSVETSSGITASISPGYISSGCTIAEYPVKWTDVVNVTENGNDISRPSGSGWGTSGAASVSELSDNMYMYTVVNETNRRRMIGLSNGNTNAHFNTIDFALYLNSNGNVNVYESGTNRGNFGSYSTGDTMMVYVESGQVNYYRNSTLLYSSGVSPVFPLVVDASLNTNSATLENVTIGGYIDGVFTCTAHNGGANPTYQWKLNGSNVGTNSTSYTNTGLSNGDIVLCEVIPDIVLCNSSTLVTSPLTIKAESSPNFSAAIEPAYLTNGCFIVEAPVEWEDIVGVNVSNNSLSRPSGSGWNTGAASVNTVTDNMYMYTVVNETNRRRMVGLSNGNTNAHYNTIDFALYLNSNGNVYVFESGTNRGNFGAYANGDTLKVYVESGQVNYYQNSTLLYSSTLSPVFPLLVDASLNTSGSTLENVTVGGYTNGDFNCTAQNVGVNPTYQWKLNGSNVGTNSASYSNSSFITGDVLSCEVTPSIAFCGALIIETNSYDIYETVPGITQTTWDGSVNTNWNTPGNWSAGVPNTLTNVVIPAGMPNYPVVNTNVVCRNLVINNGASLEISNSDTVRLLGGLVNNGTFTTVNGNILFNPDCDGAVELYNSTPHDFYNITLDEGVIVNINGSAVRLRGALALENGTLNTNDSLIVVSDAVETGRITEIKSGSINGNIEMQRYIDAGATHWRFLTFAVSGQDLEAFDDDFVTSGFPGSDFPDWPTAANPWSSFYYYDEALGTNFNDGFYVPTSSADLVGVGQGLWIWSGDNLAGTQAFTIDAFGPPNQGNISLPVTYTPSSGIANEDGWNMVANPYPCTINWDAAGWTKNNIDGSIFIWNPDLALYASYVGGVGTSMGSNKIASSQAFWVHSTGPSPQLEITESCKLNEDHGFIKKSAYQPQLLRLQLNTASDSLWDETVLRFESGTTNGFDANYDAYKFYSSNVTSSQIASTLNGDDYSINSFDLSGLNSDIQLKIVLTSGDSCTIQATDISGIENMNCVLLEDLQNGTVTNLLQNSSYTFYQVAYDSVPRFSIKFKTKPSVSNEIPSCFGMDNASIQVATTNQDSLSYSIFNSLGDTLQILDDVLSGSLTGLAPGVYYIDYTNGLEQCAVGTDSVVIQNPLPLMPVVTVEGISCNNCCDGRIEISTAGGKAPYTYSWSSSSVVLHSNVATGLCAGNYLVTITDENGCDTTIVITVPSTVGVDEQTDVVSLKVYPNPASTYAVVEADNNINIGDIKVFNNSMKDVSGLVDINIIDRKKVKLNLNRLSVGTYYLRINSEMVKLVKE